MSFYTLKQITTTFLLLTCAQISIQPTISKVSTNSPFVKEIFLNKNFYKNFSQSVDLNINLPKEEKELYLMEQFIRYKLHKIKQKLLYHLLSALIRPIIFGTGTAIFFLLIFFSKLDFKNLNQAISICAPKTIQIFQFR